MIYDYQQATYDKLLRACWSHQRSLGVELEIKTRPHRLLIGPTGTGKTHLATAVAKTLNWDCLTINASAYVLTGARGEPTWHTIRDWITESQPRRPRVLILDEIDKTGGEESWCRMLRAELFSLLDGRPAEQTGMTTNLEERLERLMIIGCGAFQGSFDAKPSMGFGSEPPLPLTQDQLHNHMQRELVNRFHQEILILPELSWRDYEVMMDSAISCLSGEDREHALRIGKTELPKAVLGKVGARFPEALISAVFDEITRNETPSPWVAPLSSMTQEEEDEIWDTPIN